MKNNNENVKPQKLVGNDSMYYCDAWYNFFIAAHMQFRRIATRTSATYFDIRMILNASESKNGKCLRLDLWKGDKIIQEGPILELANDNELFDYLFARVIDYYIENNYQGARIDINALTGYWHLYSSSTGKKPDTILAYLENICANNTKYQHLVALLAACHNSAAILTQYRILNNMARELVPNKGETLLNSINLTRANCEFLSSGLNISELINDEKTERTSK